PLEDSERPLRADSQRDLDAQRPAARLERSNNGAGALDELELRASERGLVADRGGLVDAEMRVAERQVELFRALGGGWQAAPSPSHQENGQ
ncbi:TolC family protein, partial [Pseudomonas aeruginosa]